MINVGRRNIDGFEELGDEVEIILGDVQELVVLSNLIHPMLVLDYVTENIETNLL